MASGCWNLLAASRLNQSQREIKAIAFQCSLFATNLTATTRQPVERSQDQPVEPSQPLKSDIISHFLAQQRWRINFFPLNKSSCAVPDRQRQMQSHGKKKTPKTDPTSAREDLRRSIHNMRLDINMLLHGLDDSL